RYSFGLTLFCAIQAFALYWLSPWIFSVFSRGRWTAEAQIRMVEWFGLVLPAYALFESLLFWNGWLSIRRSFQRLVLVLYVPWAIGSAGIYAWFARTLDVDAVARANQFVMLFFAGLLLLSSLVLKKR